MNHLVTLADQIHHILSKRGDSTAKQIREALLDGLTCLRAGQVSEILEVMLAAGRVRRVKQYFRAVIKETL